MLGLAVGIIGNNWDDFEGTFDTRGAAIDLVTNRLFAPLNLPPVVGDAIESAFSQILRESIDSGEFDKISNAILSSGGGRRTGLPGQRLGTNIT